jgi:PAS domain-containing protein
LIAVLYLENNLLPSVFTPRRIEVLTLLASQAAISLESAYLYSDLKQAHADLEIENSERRRVEEALRRSEAYLAQAQNISHTGSFGWDISNGEIYWSEETFRIFEFDRSTKPTVDLLMRQRVHPDDVADSRVTGTNFHTNTGCACPMVAPNIFTSLPMRWTTERGKSNSSAR